MLERSIADTKSSIKKLKFLTKNKFFDTKKIFDEK